jgi:hypothetical protein
MIFKDTELLTNLYEGITNNKLQEKKHMCDCKGDCKRCRDKKDLDKKGKKELEEAKKGKKPEFLYSDKNKDEDEPMSKTLKKKAMKEGLLTFKDRFETVMTENDSRRKSINRTK